MDSKKLRPFVVLPTLLLLLFASLVLFANSLIQKPSVQKALLDRLSEWTGYTISLDATELYLWKGLGIRVHDFQAQQKEGAVRMSASQAIVFVDALQLLRGHVVPKRLHVERPIIDLAPSDHSGGEEGRIEENLFALVLLPRLDSLTIEKGSLFIKRFPIRFVNLNLEIKRAEATTLNVKCQGEARLRRESTPFRLQGAITHSQNNEKKPSVDLSLEMGKMPLQWVPFPEEVPVKDGVCEAQLKIEAKSNEAAKVSGQILIKSARFSVREKGRTKDYSIKSMAFDLRSFVERGKIHIPYLKLKTPDASFSVSLRLDLQEKENPYLRLEGQSLLMPFSTVEALFPAPLVTPWVERELFPLLRSGDVLLESFLIDGRVLQLKKLELPENQGTLAMGFDCKNFTVHGDRLRDPLKDVSAKVTLKDGMLLVSEFKGVSGKSQIHDGYLKVGNVFRPHPVFEPWVRGAFDLEDLLHQWKADFLPPRFKEMVENTESASGTMEGHVRFKMDANPESAEITEADLLFRECALKQKHWPFALTLKEGRVRIGAEGRFRGSGSWGDSTFEAEGAFLTKGLSADPQWMELVARLDLGQLWPVISPGWSPAVLKGSALCRASLRKDADLWSVKGTADLGSVTVDHELFLMDSPGEANRVTFEFDLIPEKRIRFRQVLWEPGKSQLNLSGDYPLSPESEITLHCSSPTLSLEDLGLQLKPGGFAARGALKGKLQAKILKNDLSRVALSGEMKGESLSFVLPSLPSPVRECNFTALFTGEHMVIPSFTMRTGESSLKGKGELRGWNGLKGDLMVTSSSLNFSDFIDPEKERREKKPHGSFVKNTNLRVSLHAQPARWKNISSETLEATLQFSKGGLYITESTVQIDRGSLELIGYVKEDTMAFSCHMDFKDQPVEALLRRLGIEELYEGNLTMEARLYSEGKELRDLVSHLDGGTNVVINKGVIRKSNVFLKILEFLSLQNIFTKRPPDLSKEGLYFESLGGHGKIEQGVLSTENLQMKSPVLNAVGAGKIDLPQGLVDYDLGVQPLGTIDTVVSNIPILGHILTGDNQSLVTYYFEVTGPILNPQVEHVPFKSLGKGVTGVLQRLFLSPVKLFEDISDGVKKLPPPEVDQETIRNQTGGPGP
jgi:AsmA-like C-terminal region